MTVANREKLMQYYSMLVNDLGLNQIIFINILNKIMNLNSKHKPVASYRQKPLIFFLVFIDYHYFVNLFTKARHKFFLFKKTAFLKKIMKKYTQIAQNL